MFSLISSIIKQSGVESCVVKILYCAVVIYIGEKMNVYQLKNGCVEIQVRHYPPKRYKVYRYKLKSRKNSLAIYVHDQKDTECSIAFWVTIIPRLCHDELCGDSRE